MLSSPEPEHGFDLDYDDLGETRKLKVDPWTGDVLPGQTNDPDRTRRIRVDPWTGKVLSDGSDDTLRPELRHVLAAPIEYASHASAEPRVALPLVAFIAVMSLVVGLAFGTVVTLVLHSF
jgi:hypothetical protein